MTPRFGFRLNAGAGVIFVFDSSYSENGFVFDTYVSDDYRDIVIKYKNRFHRTITIESEGNYKVIEMYLDGNTRDIDGNLSMDFFESELLWKDSSGIFYRIYILTILFSVLSIFFYKKSFKVVGSSNKILKFISFFLFAVSLLISLRVL